MQQKEEFTKLTRDKQTADIASYPPLERNIDSESPPMVILGDLHGNPIKLIYSLVREGIFSLENKEYEELVSIYDKYESTERGESLDRLDQILAKAKVNPNAHLCLIGDELADRGKDDALQLKVIKKIIESGVKLDILASNHGMEFIAYYEAMNQRRRFETSTNPITSLIGLKHTLENNALSQEEFKELVNAYLPHVKLLNYSLSDDKNHLLILSHAGIGLETIQALAAKFNVRYDESSAIALAQTIERINYVFQQEYVAKGKVHKLGSPKEVNRPFEYPVDFLVWNRSYDELERPSSLNNFSISFAHGHDIPKETPPKHVYALDNPLGKSPIRTLFDRYISLSSNGKQLDPTLISEAIYEVKEGKSQFDTNDKRYQENTAKWRPKTSPVEKNASSTTLEKLAIAFNGGLYFAAAALLVAATGILSLPIMGVVGLGIAGFLAGFLLTAVGTEVVIKIKSWGASKETSELAEGLRQEAQLDEPGKRPEVIGPSVTGKQTVSPSGENPSLDPSVTGKTASPSGEDPTLSTQTRHEKTHDGGKYQHTSSLGYQEQPSASLGHQEQPSGSSDTYRPGPQ